MKLLIPLLAVFCFALTTGCKSTCCGSCGGHGHAHADGAKECCGKDGECCKKPAAE